VIHKAFVEVNEEGTEAAAATAGVVAMTAMPMPPKVFRADRPFIFMILGANDEILFIGRMADPR
jgi:serpin B